MNNTRNLRQTAAFCALAIGGLSAVAQPTGQWDFNAGNLNPTVGAALQYLDGAGGPTQTGTRFGTTTAFGIPDIGGSPAQVMMFPAADAGQGYSMPTPAAANGGGTLVNNYTILFDLLFPAASMGKVRGLVETDGGALNPDVEFVVGANNGVGAKGATFGALKADTWHRVGIVVEGSAGLIRSYVDGVEVSSRRVTGLLDGRYALNPGSTAGLFTDDDAETAIGYVNSIQLRNVALSKGQLLALGGATSAGLPQTLPPVPSSVEQWTPAGEFSSRSTPVGAVISTGDTTIQDSSISLKLNGQVQANPSITRDGQLITVRTGTLTLTPSTDYTLELTYTDSLAGQKTLQRKFTAALFYEDFESVTLGPRKDEDNAATEAFEKAWTNKPPTGWNVDNSQFPAVVISPENPDEDGDGYADQDGRTEWAGWSFANKDFWIASDNQTRDQFALAQGTLAIADPDEWDDLSHAVSLFNSFLKTPEIVLDGVAANTAFLKFASSWRPEGYDDNNTSKFPVGPDGEAVNNQTAIITVAYDNGTPIQVFKYDSKEGSPTFKPDAQNESILVQLNNPAGAKKMVLSFEMRDGANDWWWAVDNVTVSAGAAPPVITQEPASVEATEGQPASVTVTATGESLTYQWFRGLGQNRTPVAGATGATLGVAVVKIEDAGYYSVDIKNASGTATSKTAKLTVLPKTAGRIVLLDENFDSLPLGPNVDEGVAGDAVWTKTPPKDWSIDDTGVPGAGTDEDGVTEWAGWSFAKREWWAQTAGDQQRSQFSKAAGTAAVADSDEWDDVAHAAGNMATYLKTKPISLTGVKPGSVVLTYDSSWRPETPQKANVAVSFDGAAPVEVFRYDSEPTNASFRPDETNETISFRINNPAGAKTMQIIWGYFDTRNNWWFAIDNISVLADPPAIFREDFEGLVLGPNREEGITTGSGGAQAAVWTKTPPAGWTIDDTGVPGLGTAEDGVIEWAGWSFAKREWWASTAGDQQRTQFAKGVGTVAIADSDEWDDLPNPPADADVTKNMRTLLATPAIDIVNQAAGTLYLKFDSSWRAEDPQKANITVSYDGAPATEVLRWESSGANLHPDATNESVTVPLRNPAGAKSVKITFGYFDTYNNWWWAIDNLEIVTGDPVLPPSEVKITSATVVNGGLNIEWTGGTGPFLVQGTLALGAAWTDVVTTSARSVTLPIAAPGAFFRVVDGTSKTVRLFTAVINGAAERPIVETPGFGSAMVSLDGSQITCLVGYTGLKAPATASHLHGPASEAESAGVMVPLTAAGALGNSGYFVATATLTADQKTALESGRIYVNIHTSAHPGGEIRGQLKP